MLYSTGTPVTGFVHVLKKVSRVSDKVENQKVPLD